jgi:hypothetical protein
MASLCIKIYALSSHSAHESLPIRFFGNGEIRSPESLHQITWKFFHVLLLLFNIFRRLTFAVAEQLAFAALKSSPGHWTSHQSTQQHQLWESWSNNFPKSDAFFFFFWKAHCSFVFSLYYGPMEITFEYYNCYDY